MHLRSLTMKGFKSFADPTTVELEPGITVVVGPNGSGKSNVVDAVAWVLGAQGPSVVRSQKMDDVIFAGTQKRSALGRAEVTLVIDNADRRLPVDFSEVTVRRTLFRSGESEYELNGVTCRLLDVQELLSDSGVGRTQHVIVSQGQLDAILSARPEERRAVIEEAAGVLKYRRRRERAARRLEGSEQGLLRVEDLLREVRRQLRPLERQAAAANRYAELQAELDFLRRHLATDELRTLASSTARLDQRAGELAARTDQMTGRLDELASRLAEVELEADAVPTEELGAPIGRLSQLLERARGLSSLVDARARAKAELVSAIADASSVEAIAASLSRHSAELERCGAEEASLRDAERQLAADEAALAERRGADDEALAGTDGDIEHRTSAMRASVEQRRALLGAERSRLAELTEREGSLTEREAALRASHRSLEEEAERLRAELAIRTEELGERQAAERQAAAARQAAERALAAASEERHGLESRVEALLDALEGAREAAGVELLFGMPGVLGTLLELVEVDGGASLAFEAAVEHALSAIVVTGNENGRAALSHLLAIGRGASLLVVSEQRATRGDDARALPEGAMALRSAVRGADEWVERLLDQLLEGVLLVPGGFGEALELVARSPDVIAVTLEGDRLAPTGWRIGAARSGATKAALEAARARLVDATRVHEEAQGQHDDAVRVHERVRSATTALEAELAPLAPRLSAITHSAGEQAAAAEVLDGELVTLRSGIERERRALADAESALADAAHALVVLEEEEAAWRSAQALAAAQHSALDAEQSLLTERRRAIERSVAAITERRSQLVAREEELRSELAVATEHIESALRGGTDADDERRALEGLRALLGTLSVRLAKCSRELGVEQEQRIASRAERLGELGRLRAEREQAEAELAALGERRQRIAIEQTEARVRAETAVEALSRELDLTPEQLFELPLPSIGEGVDPKRRWREADQELRQLGPVNLLAATELSELTERNRFLEGQLEDIRGARRELNQVIRAIDEEIVSVFTAAFADVATNFERLIERLFPGGSGALYLTSPDDLLESGVEIEARPAGRNVRRLSLLSGGERSLVALAFLFAVFRSRPSPFYLMDEVEAALDDANLQRFLSLIDDFREEAQLIIVSHQKRTMEVADALYGISMQPGGASRVVSERLRSREPHGGTAMSEAPGASATTLS